MALPKRYKPKTVEPQLQQFWQEVGVYHFSPTADGPVYSVDTPPPTVSGRLHLGHTYSYSHPDFLARFWRMKGHNVFYPMGFDDNGLPTERLVERELNIIATEVGREAFIQRCLEVSEQVAEEYRAVWQRLGLSIDWRYTYRTIDELSRRTSQLSFLDLYRKGLAYRQKAPSIWCPECNTAIAQAELDDLERESEFVTLAFGRADGEVLPIATTRPELLPACVAIFVHPEDERFGDLVGQQVTVPIFGQSVPVLTDPAADPEKGTGVVMCCTFGDVTDVAWWYQHQLPLIEAIGPDGRMTEAAGKYANLPVAKARREIKTALEVNGLLLDREPISQTVRVHERCDTPVEYTVTPQWFIRILENKDEFLAAGEQINWHPPHMKARYRAWVENLHWDWCISRQRYYGVTFPVWYCDECGAVMVADEDQLPIDPTEHQPDRPCACGGTRFSPEEDVMDTWATSSLTPQIVGQWLADEGLYQQVFPMTLRPQAHEIIRTWAFYTIVKSHYHFGSLPWTDVAISGWGLAPEGSGKISKSRGGGPMSPAEMFDLYSADAVRYWAASTGLGRDSVIDEEKIKAGARLVTKLWNVARFSQRFLLDYELPAGIPPLTPADRWILSRLQGLIQRTTDAMENADYATAKHEVESFFWKELADNYLEMAKLRLYDEADPMRPGACYALYHVLLNVIKLLAPILPFITERIYRGLFASGEAESIHRSIWPTADGRLLDPAAEQVGGLLVEVATAVRRYKSEHNLPLSTELAQLQLASTESTLAAVLHQSVVDLISITRAQQIQVVEQLDERLKRLPIDGVVAVALRP